MYERFYIVETLNKFKSLIEEKGFYIPITGIYNYIRNYGVPAALKIIVAWKVDKEPTQADIDALKEMVAKPESYFED